MKLTARLMVWTSFVALGAAAGPVHASAIPQSADAPAIGGTAPVQLAQAREAEVFIDRDGNEVLVDTATGQVISVRPLRRPQRDVGRYERPRDAWRERARRDWQEDDEFWRYDAGYPDDREETYSYREAPRERVEPRRRDEEQAYPETPRRQAAKPAPRPSARPTEPQVAVREPVTAGPEIIEEGSSTLSTGSVTAPPAAKPAASVPAISGVREEVAELQVLLDRFGASPGVIDGRFGLNVDKAIVSFNAITGKNLQSTDAALVKELLAASGADAFTTYTITAADAAGPYVASVPEDYGEKAKLDRLSYTSVPEALAERFHMDEGYLKALNRDLNFNRPGTVIRVVNAGKPAVAPVVRVIADKGNRQVRGYGADGRLVVAYPASIGSADTPSPTGVHKVSRVAIDPGYTYNPKVNFKQGGNDKILTLPPGPNGPVGSIWIALDKPTYGVHGTPEPSRIGRGESHGCVRLTNWDAVELAKLVKAGVPVEFVE